MPERSDTIHEILVEVVFISMGALMEGQIEVCIKPRI